MAKSKSFFGLRKGSTKSHTYSVLDGQQVTKDRVYDVKNPRTMAQMRQRMLMTTVGAAYKYLKTIADHSFEGKSSGIQCMRAFNSANLNRFKAAARQSGSVPFNEYKDSLINPLPFQLSEGTLPGFAFAIDTESKLAVEFVKEGGDLSTCEGIYSVMGIKKGDLITFCTVRGTKSLKSGIFDYKPDAFDIVRLVADRTGAVSSIVEAFTVSANSAEANVEIEDVANGFKIKSLVCDFGAVIQSRKANDTWQRSTAYMVVNPAVTAGALTDNQFGTYPVGNELILNNGQMTVEDENPVSSLPAPELNFANSSISITGATTKAAPSLSGIPSGATVTYSSSNPAVASVNASTGIVTGVSNGTCIITATTTATDEYKAGKATFNVTVSGIVQTKLTISPSEWDIESENVGATKTFSFSNPSNANVTVNVGSTGCTYTVAANKQSVTLTLTAGKAAGIVTIAVGSMTGEITLIGNNTVE